MSGSASPTGPDYRSGARGVGWSIYILDPDDNLVELRTYESVPGRRVTTDVLTQRQLNRATLHRQLLLQRSS